MYSSLSPRHRWRSRCRGKDRVPRKLRVRDHTGTTLCEDEGRGWECQRLPPDALRKNQPCCHLLSVYSRNIYKHPLCKTQNWGQIQKKRRSMDTYTTNRKGRRDKQDRGLQTASWMRKLSQILSRGEISGNLQFGVHVGLVKQSPRLSHQSPPPSPAI